MRSAHDLGRHPTAKLLLPIVVLRIAQPEGKHRVGQLSALPVAGMDADQHCPVVATLNVPGIQLRGVHGVVSLEG
jgi:hypothetical protein